MGQRRCQRAWRPTSSQCGWEPNGGGFFPAVAASRSQVSNGGIPGVRQRCAAAPQLQTQREQLILHACARRASERVFVCCHNDEQDAAQCRRRGSLVAEVGGLLERSLWTRCLPEGSWCSFLDDDFCHVHKPDHLSLRELVSWTSNEYAAKAVLWVSNSNAVRR